MRIRWKVIGGIIFSIGIILLILQLSKSSFVLQDYRNLEREAAVKDLNRVMNLLNREIEVLGNAAKREAHWGESDKLVQDPGRFITSDIPALEDFDLDFLAM